MDIMTLSIEHTKLSNRAKNVLRRENYRTVGEMLSLTEDKMRTIRNMGTTTIREILDEIHRFQNSDATSEVPDDSAINLQDENVEFDVWIQDGEHKAFTLKYCADHHISLDDMEMLSTRAYNILSLQEVPLGQILFADGTELANIPRMDEKTAAEVRRSVRTFLRGQADHLLSAWKETLVAASQSEGGWQNRLYLPENREIILQYIQTHDKPVDMLGLSNRACNQLVKNGYNRISDFFFLTSMELMNLPAMGKTSVEGIIASKECYIHQHESNLQKVLAGENIKNDDQYDDTVIQMLLLKLFDNDGFAGMSFSDFREKLPEQISDADMKQNIGSLIAGKKLEYVDYRCYRVYGSVIDYIPICPTLSDRDKDIVLNRLLHSTLDEIGQKYNLTRERVRQILGSKLKKVQHWYLRETGMPFFEEDYFQTLYTEYKLDNTDAQKWLGIPLYVLRYFESIKLKKGSKEISDALNDELLPPALRFRIKAYLNRNKLHLDGMWVDNKRIELEKYVVRKFCQNTVTFDKFTELYNVFLQFEEIPEDSDLYITEDVKRTRLNILSGSNFVLWSQGERLRYYDIEGQDFTEFFELINLDSYENVEYSTKKLFCQFPEAMARYDIRDHYELHNLLRKTLSPGAFHEFSLGKMPMIKFGEFNRDEAILDLLIAHAPISQTDFAEIVEQEYGYDSGVTMSTYLKPFNIYYHKGIYRTDQKQMPAEHQTVLMRNLPNDFYYLDEIRRVFRQVVPGADLEEINPYTLKSMGFLVLSRYVLRNHDNLESYFRSLLTRSDIVDITEYRKRYTYVQAFSMVLSEMKRNLEIVEMEPLRLIQWSRLEAGGMTKDAVRAFCDAVYDWTTSGDYFSIQSIKRDGFLSDLFDYGFEDWFYANLLLSDDRFCNARCFGNLIFRKEAADISLQMFESWVIRQAKVIDAFDLMSELTEKYGCSVADRYDLINKVQNTDIYYDKHLDRFYASEDLFYRELDAAEVMGA